MNKITKAIIFILLLLPINVFAMTKNEIIYANLDYKGNIKNTTITNQLSNLEKGKIIDYTDLENIENTNGKEKFTKDNYKIEWSSTGKDIFYKGKINNELPIKINTTYYLNGEEINPNKIKNKSGHIKISINLTNKEYNKEVGMYVPYVVDATTIIGNNNTNIKVTNGTTVSNGKNNIITAIASPGLYKSTGINEFSSLDNITIEFDTTKYKFNEIYFVITPKLLDKVDINKINKVDELNNSLNTLQDSMNKVVDGSKTLTEGSNTINNSLIELNNGIKQALDGSKELNNGLNELNNGITKFKSITDLTTKLYNTYITNEELLKNIQSGVTKEQLEQGIKNATIQKTQLENQLNEVNAGIKQLEELPELTEEQNIKLETLKSTKQQLEQGIEQINQGIIEAQNNLASLPQAAAKISGADEVIKEILISLLGVPDISYVNEETINMFNNQINTLVEGTNKLKEGSDSLTNGLEKIYDGSNKLVEGNNKLNNGTKELSEGLEKLNTEGINKLTNYGNMLINYKNKLRSLVNLSKNYTGFAADNVNNTTFIYKLSK